MGHGERTIRLRDAYHNTTWLDARPMSWPVGQFTHHDDRSGWTKYAMRLTAGHMAFYPVPIRELSPLPHPALASGLDDRAELVVRKASEIDTRAAQPGSDRILDPPVKLVSMAHRDG